MKRCQMIYRCRNKQNACLVTFPGFSSPQRSAAAVPRDFLELSSAFFFFPPLSLSLSPSLFLLHNSSFWYFLFDILAILSFWDEWLDLDTREIIMSLFSDAQGGHLQCHKTSWSGADLITPQGPPVKRHSLLKSILIPSLSSIVKNSLTWAENGFSTYRDGLSKEQRKARIEREDRRQILYLRMRNVGYFPVR